MFIGKALGPVLAIFKNPYKNLTHQALTVPIDKLIEEIQLDVYDSVDYDALIMRLGELGTQIQFKIGTFNHDWELGQLDLTLEEGWRHSAGIGYDVNLMYWKCLQLGSTYIPALVNLKETANALTTRFGEYIETANYIDPEMFKNYKVGSLAKPLKEEILVSSKANLFPPVFSYNVIDFTENVTTQQGSHEEYMYWATPKYDGLTVDPLVRVKNFTTLLTQAFDVYDQTPIKTFAVAEQLVTSILYAITVSHRNDDLFILSCIDTNSRESFKRTHTKGSNLDFAMFRDANLITNGDNGIMGHQKAI